MEDAVEYRRKFVKMEDCLELVEVFESCVLECAFVGDINVVLVGLIVVVISN